MSLPEAAYQAFEHFYHQDLANAHIHCSPVRFSPITFRLAEALAVWDESVGGSSAEGVVRVLDHRGHYAEDRGRTGD